MEKHRVTVTVAGRELKLLTSDPESHVHRVASFADGEIKRVRAASASLSALDAVLFAAVDLADRLIKADDTAENMRNQLKDYLEEVTKIKNENADLRRENNKLKKQ